MQARTSQLASCSPRCAGASGIHGGNPWPQLRVRPLIVHARLDGYRQMAHSAGAAGVAQPFLNESLHMVTSRAARRAIQRERVRCTGLLVEHETFAQEPEAFTFKYKRLPCSSPCQVDDVRCHQVEALFQHVLNYPRIPSRVCQALPAMNANMATITRTIEGLAHKYGQELTILFLRRSPHLLQFDLETLLSRAEHMRSMLDLKPSEVFMVLRKNPNVFCTESQLLRARYNALHKVLPLSHEGIKTLVRKYPLILNYQTSSIEYIMDALRQLSYMRSVWQGDFDNITPSLLAFFFRDSRDLLQRLEFLVATGNSPFIKLQEVFKMTNNLFARKNRGFDAWLQERAMQRQRRQMLMRQQVAQREAQAQVLAQLRAGGDGGAVPGGVGAGEAQQAGWEQSGMGRRQRVGVQEQQQGYSESQAVGGLQSQPDSAGGARGSRRSGRRSSMSPES